MEWLWKLVLRGMVGAVALVALLWLADWAVWRVRVARGGGYGAVTVTRVVVAPLKGGREEYYQDGTVEERCAPSVVEHGGVRACWWVERHKMVWDR